MMLPEIVYRPVQQGADDAVEVSFMVPCLNEEAERRRHDRDDHERPESASGAVTRSWYSTTGRRIIQQVSSRPFRLHTRKRRSDSSVTRSIVGFPSTSWRPPFKGAVAIIARSLATTWNRWSRSSRPSALVVRQILSFPISWKFETGRFDALSYPSCIRAWSIWRAGIGWRTTTEIHYICDLM